MALARDLDCPAHDMRHSLTMMSCSALIFGAQF
jgi:hypothetical protein